MHKIGIKKLAKHTKKQFMRKETHVAFRQETVHSLT